MENTLRFRYVLEENGKIMCMKASLEDVEKGNLTWVHQKGQTTKVIARNQYTGRKTHYNKPIYEGDLIREVWAWADVDDGFKYPLRVVKWDEAYSGPQWCAPEIKSGHTDYYGGIPDEVEIVGNIYENPELVEAAKNGLD